jgi:hypothetical protein
VSGDTVNEHVPACVTVTFCPATVTIPLRCVVNGLAATEMFTVSLPLRFALPLTVNQLAPLETVHEQPASVVTETLAVPPLTGIEWDVGDTVLLHTPLCMTVTIWPATVRVPLRDDD